MARLGWFYLWWFWALLVFFWAALAFFGWLLWFPQACLGLAAALPCGVLWVPFHKLLIDRISKQIFLAQDEDESLQSLTVASSTRRPPLAASYGTVY